jgi:predicted CoA-binding protein
MEQSMNKKIIAVVGVSDNKEKFGYRIWADLKSSGYNVFAIGIKDGEVNGEKIYLTLEELPQKPDIVVTVVPPPTTEKIVDEIIELGIKEIWMQPGSVSQTANQKAIEAGIKVTADKCFMKTEGIW